MTVAAFTGRSLKLVNGMITFPLGLNQWYNKSVAKLKSDKPQVFGLID